MKFNYLLFGAALMSMTFCACSDDDNNGNGGNGDGGNDGDGSGIVADKEVSGNVEGVWEANTVVSVTGHIVVPEGKSLTIEEGVTVVFDDKGVGVNHTPIEFTVDGNLYCKELKITLSFFLSLKAREQKPTSSRVFGEVLLQHRLAAKCSSTTL